MSGSATILPLGDRLKVLPLRPPEATPSGILIPEVSAERERPLSGLVLAGGRGTTQGGVLAPLECLPGDVVYFGKYAGIYVFDAEIGQDVMLMREAEALGRQKEGDIALVEHDGHHGLHVPGDPRCEQCRAGRRLAGVA